MEINPKIFRAYDIRGVYKKDFDDDTFYYIGNAFAAYLQKIQKFDFSSEEKPKILVGRDTRSSSETLAQCFMEGVLDFGFDVLDAGEVTTPMFAFCAGETKAFGGAMVTASHNPAGYNGLKVVKEMAMWTGDWIGGEELQELLKTEKQKEKICRGDFRGVCKKVDLSEDYLNSVAEGFEAERKLKIVVDASGGATALFLPRLLKKLKIDFIPLFFETDGTFSKHNPNPTLEESQDFVKAKVEETGADFGVIFDGDGDRMVVVDEKSEAMRGDVVGGIIADAFLGSRGSLIYDVTSTSTIKEYFEKKDIKTTRTRVGHYFIKKIMEETGTDFALENSSHYYFKKMHYAESAFYALRWLLTAMNKSPDKKISELAAPFSKHFTSGVINIDFELKEKWPELLEKIKEKYKKYRQSFEDGVSVEGEDFWFNLRLSNTEPVVRLVVEADSSNLLEEKKKEISAVIVV